MIEYIEWYSPGQKMMRCQSCGALLVDGDMELHTKWHEDWSKAIVAVARQRSSMVRALDGTAGLL